MSSEVIVAPVLFVSLAAWKTASVPPEATEPNARSVTRFVPATPKLYSAPVADDPVPVLYVVRVEYQPGIVELSVHVMPVPVMASVSKLSVSGTPSAVMLPPLVNAYEDGTNRELCMAT